MARRHIPKLLFVGDFISPALVKTSFGMPSENEHANAHAVKFSGTPAGVNLRKEQRFLVDVVPDVLGAKIKLNHQSSEYGGPYDAIIMKDYLADEYEIHGCNGKPEKAPKHRCEGFITHLRKNPTDVSDHRTCDIPVIVLETEEPPQDQKKPDAWTHYVVGDERLARHHPQATNIHPKPESIFDGVKRKLAELGVGEVERNPGCVVQR